MKFENIKVFNFEGALRGMRNPKNSWNKSDSFFGLVNIDYSENDFDVAYTWAESVMEDEEDEGKKDEIAKHYDEWLIKNGLLDIDYNQQVANVAFIGPDDMRLARQLIAAGSEHRKFLRQIVVTVDITAPLFWWKEADTYKVGTTANSTSTMHKLTDKPITLSCFETGDYCPEIITSGEEVNYLIQFLEGLRQKYKATKDKRYWKELVRWLPESWLQTRTITLSYENIRNMVHQRSNHKLVEWSKEEGEEIDSFIKFAHTLPYSNEFIFD